MNPDELDSCGKSSTTVGLCRRKAETTSQKPAISRSQRKLRTTQRALTAGAWSEGMQMLLTRLRHIWFLENADATKLLEAKNHWQHGFPSGVVSAWGLCPGFHGVQCQHWWIMAWTEIYCGWWFGTWLLFFHILAIGNNHPNWLSYFSEGLKPPTSIIFTVGSPTFCVHCWLLRKRCCWVSDDFVLK